MSEILEETYAYCRHCGKPHPARLIRKDSCVYGITDCPQNAQSPLLVSTDSNLFERIRSRSSYTALFGSGTGFACNKKRRIVAGYLNLTNDCNARCPVCFASSGEEHAQFLSIESLTRRIARLRSKGIRMISLFGGEPTVHPDIVNIVRICKKYGVKTELITNGIILANKPEFARKLKKAGLSHVNLQFETLDPALHQAIRGPYPLSTKFQAINNCSTANLSVRLVATVTRAGLSEFPALLSFAMNVSGVSALFLQGAVNEGRFILDNTEETDREEIIHALCGNGTTGLSSDNFYPVPCIPFLSLYMHPDCVALSAALKTKSSYTNLNTFIDIRLLYSRIQKPLTGIRGFLSFVHTILFSIRWRYAPRLACIFVMSLFARKSIITSDGTVKKPRKKAIIPVFIESYKSAKFQDIQKTDLCQTIQVLDETDICACVFNSRGAEHPFSRVSVESRNEL